MSHTSQYVRETARMSEAPTSRRPQLVMAALATVGAAWLAHSLWFNAHYVETDNAQVGSDIVPISSRISGFVASVAVRENQTVAAGQLLATLDDRDARARLAQLEAELASARSAAGQPGQTGQAAAQVAAAQAQTRQARALVQQVQAEQEQAQREFIRVQTLLSRGLVSQRDLDIANANARASAARLQAARDAANAASRQTQASEAALRGADARLLAAQAARDVAANTLTDTHIVAPFAGMVSQKTVEPGQFMQPGQPMMNLVGLQQAWVVANLKETQLDGIRVGSPAEFTVDAYPGKVWKGQVESLSPATGSKFTLLPPDNATGNFTKVVQRVPVRIHITRGQHNGVMLRPGMSAVVTLRKD